MNIVKKVGVVTAFLFVAAMLTLFPKPFCKAFLDGLTLWAINVLPVLLPFALLAPAAAKCLPTGFSVTEFLFGIQADGIFFSSLICGYPVGAKLVSLSDCNAETAAKTSAFCSVPGPIFLFATVGPLLGDIRATAIVAASQLAACVCTGLFFRDRSRKQPIVVTARTADKDFGQSITDAVLSVMNVGALIAFVYMLTAMLKSIFPSSLSESVIFNFVTGLAEMTNGIFAVTSTCDNLTLTTTLSSALLAFGGVAVMLQSMSFFSAKGMTVTRYLSQKVIQGAIATIVSFLLCVLFLR